jgi:hypothetical protein
MKKLMLCVVALTAMLGGVARGQDVSGNWQGTVETNSGLYRIVLRISNTIQGGWAGTAYVVDTYGRWLRKPVPARIVRDGSVVRVSITEDGGGFEGSLSEDGNSIVGDYTQDDSVPMNFVRVPAQVEAPAQVELPSPPRFANSPIGPAIQDALRATQPDASVGAPAAPTAPKAGAEILSDTMGVDFSPYMRQLHDDIQRNWDRLIPEEVQPPVSKRGITGIRFTILPDGQIGTMILETPSRDVALDRAAWYAITSEGQFPALPQAFHGPLLDLRVGFFYNTPIPITAAKPDK